jgi:hypothetical protein
MKVLIARVLVGIGIVFCRLAVDFAGRGKVDVEIEINEIEQEIFLTSCIIGFSMVFITVGATLIGIDIYLGM